MVLRCSPLSASRSPRPPGKFLIKRSPLARLRSMAYWQALHVNMQPKVLGAVDAMEFQFLRRVDIEHSKLFSSDARPEARQGWRSPLCPFSRSAR
jgi:hypothetical protein